MILSNAIDFKYASTPITLSMMTSAVSGQLSFYSGISSNLATTTLLTGTKSLASYGSGVVTLCATNTYTGPTYLYGGTIEVGSLSAIGSSGDINFNGGTLRYGTGFSQNYSTRIKNGLSSFRIDTNGNNVTFSAGLLSSTLAVPNSAGLVKIGNGTLTLNSACNYTGFTILSGGTLKQGVGNAIPRGANAFMKAYFTNGQPFNSDIVDSYWFMASGTTIDVNGTSITLPFSQRGYGGKIINSHPTNQVDLGQGQPMANAAFAAGKPCEWEATFDDSSGAAFTLSVASGGFYRFLNPVQKFRGVIFVPNYAVSTANLNNNEFGSGDIQTANATINALVEYVGSTNTTTASARNIYVYGTGSGGGCTVANNGTGVVVLSGYYNTAATASTKQLTLDGTNTGANTFIGAIENFSRGGSSSNVTNVVKQGIGRWIFSGNNPYTGTTTINNGTLGFYSNTAFGNGGNIIFTGGIMQYGNNVSTDVSSRIRSSTSPINIDTNGSNVNFASSLANTNTNGLIKNGIGTLTLSNAPLYTGSTIVSGGILATGGNEIIPDTSSVSILSGATLRLGGNETINTITTNLGTIDLQSYNLTFTVNNPTTMTGSITGTTGSITKLGTGTLTLSTNTSNNFAYSGATYLSAGALVFANKLSYSQTSPISSTPSTTYVGIGLGGSGINDWTTTDFSNLYNFGTVYNLNVGPIVGLAVDTTNGNITLNELLTASRAMLKTGSNTLTFGGTNTNSGLLYVEAGGIATNGNDKISNGVAINLSTSSTSLALGGNNNIGSITGSGSTNLSTYTLSANADNTNTVYSGNITGTGSVVKVGSGILALSGSSTYSGGTDVRTGTLAMNSVSAIGSGALNIYGGTIDNTSAASVTLSTNNSQNWNADFTFTGTRNLNMGTGTVTMNASRIVTTSANTLTVQRINGTGYGLTKNGSGTLVASASGNYNGQTTINAGTFQIGNASTTNFVLPTSAIVVNSGATLAFNFNDGSNVVRYPSSYSVVFPYYNLTANGNILATATTGNILLSSNFATAGNFEIVTGNGGAYGIRLIRSGGGSVTRTVTASAIKITGQIGEADASHNLVLSTSATNGPITLDLQNGVGGTLFGDNVKGYAGTGTITLSGTKLGAIGWGSGCTFYGGAINISGAFSVTNGQFYALSSSNVSANLTLAGNTNIIDVPSAVSFSFTNNAIIAGTGGILTKSGAGTLALSSYNHTSTSTLTMSQGKVTRTVTSSGFTGNAEITPAAISVDFGGSTPTSGTTYRFWNGAISPTVTSVTLTNAGGKTGSFNSTNSTLTINI
jgi:fibronectin-binding autotransporter adhesin